MKKSSDFRVFPLSNIWWVDIHNTLTIWLFCTRFPKERYRKVSLLYEDRIELAVRSGSRSSMYNNNQFRTKNSLNLGLKQEIVHTVTLKHSK